MTRAALALAATLIAAPAAAREACPPGLVEMRTAELMFGLMAQGGEAVAEADWRRFMDAEVTPRFPAGLTVWDAAGQWRAPDGALTREPAKVLLLVLAGAPDEAARIGAVVDAYKRRFHQRSVLVVESAACAAF